MVLSHLLASVIASSEPEAACLLAESSQGHDSPSHHFCWQPWHCCWDPPLRYCLLPVAEPLLAPLISPTVSTADVAAGMVGCCMTAAGAVVLQVEMVGAVQYAAVVVPAASYA